MMDQSRNQSCPECGAPIPEEAPEGLCPGCALAKAAEVTTRSQARGRAVPPPLEDVATEFPELEILEAVGAGGMGAVYKARQPKLDRLVALKILSSDLAEDPAFEERFNREARVLARLSHPNIVAVFDFGTRGPFCYLLMEFVDGVNLRQAMQAGEFTPSESLALVQDICTALQFAHDEGILHRDIKPENILIDARGRVKIADYGIAKLIGEGEGDDLTLTREGAVLGSPHYMAPEQINSPGEIDQRADIYSLGVVFYELLTGELPIGKFGPPSEKTSLDSRIDEVVMRTLEKERQRRYQSAGEVKTKVEAITSSVSPGPVMPEPSVDEKETDAPARSEGTAKFATVSAVMTGISLLLVVLGILCVAALAFGAQGGVGPAPLMIVVLPFLVVTGILALVGMIMGFTALGNVRSSAGQKRGLGRAMFGALGWPVLVLTVLTALGSGMGFSRVFGAGFHQLLWFVCAILLTVAVGVFAILVVWRWATGMPRGMRSHQRPGSSRSIGPVAAVAAIIVLMPALATLVPFGGLTLHQVETDRTGPSPVIRKTKSTSKVDWRRNGPEVDLELTIAPMHVATIVMVRTDAAGNAKKLSLQGYAIAPDAEAFRGRVQIGSLAGSGSGERSQWLLRLEAFGGPTGFVGGVIGGAAVESGGNLSMGQWVFDGAEANKLELTTAGNHSMTVATRAAAEDGGAQETLTLEVVTRHRSGAGVPVVTRLTPTIGAGTTDWVKSLQSD